MPKAVLQAMRIVFIEHMDQVLSEALVLSDPEALFDRHRKPAEMRFGERQAGLGAESRPQ